MEGDALLLCRQQLDWRMGNEEEPAPEPHLLQWYHPPPPTCWSQKEESKESKCLASYWAWSLIALFPSNAFAHPTGQLWFPPNNQGHGILRPQDFEGVTSGPLSCFPTKERIHLGSLLLWPGLLEAVGNPVSFVQPQIYVLVAELSP